MGDPEEMVFEEEYITISNRQRIGVVGEEKTKPTQHWIGRTRKASFMNQDLRSQWQTFPIEYL